MRAREKSKAYAGEVEYSRGYLRVDRPRIQPNEAAVGLPTSSQLPFAGNGEQPVSYRPEEEAARIPAKIAAVLVDHLQLLFDESPEDLGRSSSSPLKFTFQDGAGKVGTGFSVSHEPFPMNVASTAFPDCSNFTTPLEFYQQTVTVPSAL